MPDIDMDFQDDLRPKMMEYCAKKYGDDKVAQIITFGTLGAKAAIRDVGRVMDVPLSEVDRVAKLIPGIRNYVSIDGGITDNPRFALYRSYHHCILPQRLDEAHDQTWAVSGKCCETGDMLSKDALLPEPRRGDLLALLCTGAYTYSMSSNYNRVPRPAVVARRSAGVVVPRVPRAAAVDASPSGAPRRAGQPPSACASTGRRVARAKAEDARARRCWRSNPDVATCWTQGPRPGQLRRRHRVARLARVQSARRGPWA